jgi:hypothetical protein
MACKLSDQIERSGTARVFPKWASIETCRHHISGWIKLPKSAGLLSYGVSTSQQMEEEEQYARFEDDVNEYSSNLKCEKPE